MNDRGKQWDEHFAKENIKALPPRIQKDIENLPTPKITEVEGTYLWGKIGSGKTIQAVFMLLAKRRLDFINRYPSTTIFITVPELLLEFKSGYSNKEGPTEEELVKKYSVVDLLVLDDFGVERTTDWSFQLLYIIINRRYENMKMTIFTSNFNLAELAEKLGDDRIPSRIQQMCKVVQSKDVNYRARK